MRSCPSAGMSRPWPNAGSAACCRRWQPSRCTSMRPRPDCRPAAPGPPRLHDIMVINETKLSRAVPTDCRLMAAIHATAFSAQDAWSETVFCRQLGFPGVFGLLHPSGGLILARVAADDAEILTLAVLPEARRSGVATALIHESAMTAAGMGALGLFLEVPVANSAARAL